MRRRPAGVWAGISIGVYTLFMSIFTLLRYQVFQTNAFDLGIFNQAFSTALKGMLFYETPDQYLIPSGSFLGTHFSPLMFVILPLYAIYPHPQTLLVLQTVVVGLGAVPIFLIARKVFASEGLAVVLAIAYLIDPAVLSMNIFDFHLEAFLPFFLGMFYYFYFVTNWKGYTLFLFLSLITIDFAALVIVAICLAHAVGALVREKGERFGITLDLDRNRRLILLGTGVTGLVDFFVQIYLSGAFSGKSSSVQGILSGFLTPARLSSTVIPFSEFWLIPLAVLMFLPIVAPSKLMVVAPWFFATLLETSHPTNYSFGYQYAGAFVFPYLLIATIFALQKLRARKADVRVLLVGIFVFSIAISPLNPLMQGHISGISYEEGLPSPVSQDAIINSALSLIPPNASVLTQNNLFPQVSARANAYVYLVDNKSSIQFVLADTFSSWYSTVIWGTQSMKGLLPKFMTDQSYGVVVNDDGVILLEQGYHGAPVLEGETTYIYDYKELDLYSGLKQSDPNSTRGVVLVHTGSEQNGVTFWFGPYASLPPGRYNATFWLEVTPLTMGSLTLMASSFVNASSIVILATSQITQQSFPHQGSWTAFTLTFDYSPQQATLGELEFRGVGVEGGPFALDFVAVSYVGPYSGQSS